MLSNLISSSIAIVGAVFLIIVACRSAASISDKRLLFLFGCLVLIWGAGHILGPYFFDQSGRVWPIVLGVIKFFGGCAAGVFLSLSIVGSWGRLSVSKAGQKVAAGGV